MSTIVIGDSAYGATNAAWTGGVGYTMLNIHNPATSDFTIATIELAMTGNQTTVAYVGTFYGSGTTWTSRSYASVGPLVSGVNVINNLNITCMTGDILGVYLYSGGTGVSMRANRIGSSNCRYADGNKFGTIAGYSLMGTYYDYLLIGGYAADGKKINGTTMSKWNGIAISKWNGV